MHKYNYVLLNRDHICINALSTDSENATINKENDDDIIVNISAELFDISLVGKKFDSSTQMFSDVPLPPKTLDETKADKISEITQAYQATTQTFVSSALGSPHTYLTDDTSMNKFNAEYTFVNSASYDGSPINWFTVEQGGVIHTKDQFNQVWMDGRTKLTSAFDNWDSLVKQVKAATDIPTIQAIAW